MLVRYTFGWKPRACLPQPESHGRAPFPEEFPLSRTLFFSAFVVLLFAAVPLAAQPPQKQLTVEAIYAHGPLIGNPPDGITWSPDGKHVTYEDGGELVDLDLNSGKPHVLVSRAKLASISGSAGSETDRDHRDRYKMANYVWAPDSAHLLFDANGRLWLYDLHNGIGLQVGFTGAAAGDDPKFSPNGEFVSFVREHSLAVIRLKDPGSPMAVVAPRAQHPLHPQRRGGLALPRGTGGA